MSWILAVVVFFYFFFNPLFEAPEWCLKYYRKHDLPSTKWTSAFTHDPFIPCELARHREVKYSGIPKVKPIISSIADVICLSYLIFFRYYKMTWKRHSK